MGPHCSIFVTSYESVIISKWTSTAGSRIGRCFPILWPRGVPHMCSSLSCTLWNLLFEYFSKVGVSPLKWDTLYYSLKTHVFASILSLAPQRGAEAAVHGHYPGSGQPLDLWWKPREAGSCVQIFHEEEICQGCENGWKQRWALKIFWLLVRMPVTLHLLYGQV